MQWFSLQYLRCTRTIEIVRVLWMENSIRWCDDHYCSTSLSLQTNLQGYLFFYGNYQPQFGNGSLVLCGGWLRLWITITRRKMAGKSKLCTCEQKKTHIVYIGPVFFSVVVPTNIITFFFSRGRQGKSFLTSCSYYIWDNLATTHPSMSPTLQYIAHTSWCVVGGCLMQQIAHNSKHHHP